MTPEEMEKLLPEIRKACAPLIKVLEQVYADHFSQSPPRCRICEQSISEVLAEHRTTYGE